MQTNLSRSDECWPCPAGSYCLAAATTPQPCVAGTYGNVTNIPSAGMSHRLVSCSWLMRYSVVHHVSGWLVLSDRVVDAAALHAGHVFGGQRAVVFDVHGRLLLRPQHHLAGRHAQQQGLRERYGRTGNRS
jgi:hypothetical protein